MSYVWLPYSRERAENKNLTAERKSEFTELDHIKTAALTATTAPFGTNYTPSYKPRIIGGNLVTVIERPVEANLPRYEKVTLISDKPNNVDPRALTDFTRRYNQPYQDPFHAKINTSRHVYITKRPDSKDISSRYPTLAPIEGNRIKNQQMSTVFEPEAWTQRYPQSDEFLTNGRQDGIGARRNHLTNSVVYTPQSSLAPSTASTSLSTTDEVFKAKILSMIPRGVFLSDTPIVLTQQDESRLLRILARELYYEDPLRLRDVYINISNTVDKHLTGFCQYQDLYNILSRMNFKFPSDLLQIVAAMFVSDHRNQRDVNYEKFLSFVGAALKYRDKIIPPSQQSSTAQLNGGLKQPGIHTPIRHRPGSPYFSDGGEVKLLRMVEEQLNVNDFVIDFDRLITSFQATDRKRRGLLSADQIKNICFQQRIPIQESLITRLLHKCEDVNRKDQYNWVTFIQLLERIQPIKPKSPINTKKQIGKSSLSPATSSSKESQSFTGYTPTPMWKRDPPLLPHKEEVPDPNREIISRMDLELKDLERNNEGMKSRSPHKQDEVPWFKNFMQFAEALYKKDEKFQGNLPYKDVAEWTKLYNEAYRLEIPDDVIAVALEQSKKKGNVDIHQFLSLLGKQN